MRGARTRSWALAVGVLLGASSAACEPPQPASRRGEGATKTKPRRRPLVKPQPPQKSPLQTLKEAADAVAPTLAAGGDGWIVGWTEERGLQSGVVAGPVNGPAVTIAATRARGIQLAAAGDTVVAAWAQLDDKGRAEVFTAPLDARGGVRGEARQLSDPAAKGGAGSPAIAGVGDAVVVAWVEGADVRAARLDAAGAALAEARWPGGNLRPVGRFGPEPTGDRAAPHLDRPVVVAEGGEAVVYWSGDFWISDDRRGTTVYRQRVDWSGAAAEPVSARAQRGPERPVAFVGGASAAVIDARHNPNGGPWELLRRRDDVETQLTSEPAGPLAAVAMATAQGEVVAWPSPARGGVALVELSGAPTSKVTPRTIPATVVHGETQVALALAKSGDGYRIAHVTRDAARPVVKVTTREKALEMGEPSPAGVSATAIADARHAPQSLAVARIDAGSWFAVWQDYWTWKIHGQWIDGQGAPQGATVALTPREKRCGQPSVASLGDAVAVAYHCCAGSSICGDTTTRLATVAPGGKPSAQVIAKGLNDPRLLVSAKGQAAVVGTRGGWGSDTVVYRIVDPAPKADALAKALGDASERTVPGAVGELALVGAVWRDGALFVAHETRPAEGELALLLTEVTAERPSALRVERGEGELGRLQHDAMESTPHGLAFVGTRSLPGHDDVFVRFVDPADATVRGAVIVAHGQEARDPSVVHAHGELAVAWYDRASDGDYWSTIDTAGVRVAGPTRLDDPAIRASGGVTAMVPLSDGRWFALWTDPQALLGAAQLAPQ